MHISLLSGKKQGNKLAIPQKGSTSGLCVLTQNNDMTICTEERHWTTAEESSLGDTARLTEC